VSRAIEVASVLGATALAGVGMLPVVHRADTPDSWFKLGCPRDVDDDAVLALLRHLAASRRPEVVTFELRAGGGRLEHLVGVARADVERLRHLFATFLPEVLLEAVDRSEPRLKRAVEVRLSTRERALRTDTPHEIARSVIAAMAGTTGTTVLQWQLGPRLSPLYVPADSLGLPTTGRMVGQAFRYGLTPLEARARTALEHKVGDQGFRAILRIGTNIAESDVARGVLRAVIGGLRVAEAPGAHFKARRTDANRTAMALPPRRWGMSINVAELVGLLAWPLGDTDYPGVARIGSRRLPVASAVANTERVIGEGNHPATRRPVALSTRDWLSTHCLGPTGVGKSTLLANVVIQDIEAGRGVVVIEPKGDLVNDVLARIPKHRQHDVVVLDPTDLVAPVGLNPLHGGSPELVTDHVLAVFRGLYGDYLGPRTADILHAAVLTLARSDRATLVALPLLLTNANLRRQLTKHVRHDLVLGPFWAWYEALSDAERAQVIAPVMNKARFLLRDGVRHVLGQAAPKFDIAQVFTKRKVVLVPLPKGLLGGETASLIGSLVVSQVWQAAQARARVAPERRHPVSIVIDEFQQYLHLPTDLADVLATARSYGVSVLLAHQHLGQLTTETRTAVLANARNRICFRLSAEDAVVIARTTDLLYARDLQSLGKYEAYASLVADSTTQPFCSLTTHPLPTATADAANVRDMSRQRYGVAREVIDAELHALGEGGSTARGSSVGSRRRASSRVETDGDER
jgi:hypothetical protein